MRVGRRSRYVAWIKEVIVRFVLLPWLVFQELQRLDVLLGVAREAGNTSTDRTECGV